MDIIIGNYAKIKSLRKDESHKIIGVLVCTTLPGLVRHDKVD